MSSGSRDTHSSNSSSPAHSLQQFDGIAYESGMNEQYQKRQRKYVQQYFLTVMVIILFIFTVFIFILRIVADHKQDLEIKLHLKV